MAKSNRSYVSASSALPGPLKESPQERMEFPLTLMLLGKTGSGKSSLGNALFGETGSDCAPFKRTSGFVACQQHEAVLEEGKIKGRTVRIIDTPGVLDNVDNEDALEGICQAISLNPDGVTAFVIVLRADVRFTQEESKAVTLLQQLFGDNFWRHAICVFTHGDDVLKKERQFFDIQVKKARDEIPNFDKLVRSVGDRLMIVNCNNMGNDKLTEFLLLLDSVRSLNEGRYYTNSLFKEAQQLYRNADGEALMASFRRSRLQLRELKAKQEQQKLLERIDELEENIRARDKQETHQDQERQQPSEPIAQLEQKIKAGDKQATLQDQERQQPSEPIAQLEEKIKAGDKQATLQDQKPQPPSEDPEPQDRIKELQNSIDYHREKIKNLQKEMAEATKKLASSKKKCKVL